MPGVGGRSGLSVEIRSKSFGSGPDRRIVISGLRFTAAPGEVVALVGPSGCGKTSTLRAVAGLDRAFEGAVAWPSGRGGGAATLGFVFQEPRLLAWRTVRDNVGLVLPKPVRTAARVDAMLHAVGLDEAGDRFPGALSGGMQRRAALARAFVTDPDLLLLDEPFVSLDEAAAGRLRAVLLSLLAGRDTVTLMVTHDLREAAELADRILVLSGPPARVIETMTVPAARGHRSAAAIEDLRRRLIEAAGRGLQGGEGAVAARGADRSALHDQ